jgi:hypothetical protein
VWHDREALREKGQFWTPDWIADAMAAYVLQDGAPEVFDPAVGAGAFLRAALRVADRMGRERPKLLGTETDPSALEQAARSGLSPRDLRGVVTRDFVLSPPAEKHLAIVANPPYVRHHRLGAERKEALRAFAREVTGRTFDGRAGLQLYFLIRCLERLAPDGRLAFIVSADVFEGAYSRSLWEWAAARFRIEAALTFAEQATPFPGVDTNPVVIFIRNAAPQSELVWAKCLDRSVAALVEWVLSGFEEGGEGLQCCSRSLREAVSTGLSRSRPSADSTHVLSEFATVMRGIVTGDNDFFFLTRARAAGLGIPRDCLVEAVGRTRDIEGDVLTKASLDALDRAGRPTLLLSIDGTPGQLPGPVAAYLRSGEQLGLPAKPLISLRNPWYKMETRRPPDFLFAYLGRRNSRFIRNLAGVVPLTCFHCVYARDRDPERLDRLWRVLQDPKTVGNLARVGKSYGGGAIKVEPRSLMRLPLPDDVVDAAGPAGVRCVEQTALAAPEPDGATAP